MPIQINPTKVRRLSDLIALARELFPDGSDPELVMWSGGEDNEARDVSAYRLDGGDTPPMHFE